MSKKKPSRYQPPYDPEVLESRSGKSFSAGVNRARGRIDEKTISQVSKLVLLSGPPQERRNKRVLFPVGVIAMKRFVMFLLAGSWCAYAVPGSAQPQDTPVPPAASKPARVEVHYVDGSVVFMTLLEQNIEVLTDFGKLTVPQDQVQSIQFGHHVDKDIETKIQALIGQLADNNFQKRELALKELIQFGHAAYPALLASKNAKDQELALRVAEALKAIEQRVPAKLLNRKMEDVVYTAKFTIVGKVLTPGLRAKTEFFGELTVKPSQLLAIGTSKQTPAAPGTLTVDAAKWGSADNQWMPTGFHLRIGQPITLIATGTVDLVPPQAGKYLCGPYGWNNGGKAQPNVEGTLQGRIGANGPPFTIGEKHQGIADRDGELYLHIVPCIWGNASTGSFQVNIVVESK